MLDFEYKNPTKIIFGKNSLEKLGKEVINYGNKVLLVYGGNSLKVSGNYQKIINILEKHNIKWIDLGGNVKPEISVVSKGVELCKKEQIDVVIGIGGGCCMDLAKAIARLAKFDNDVLTCLNDNTVIKANISLPTIMIPTNPSSGSEYDQWCELIDSKTNKSYRIIKAYPTIALLCPQLSYSLDAKQTAYGATTALIQLMSSYVAKVDNASLANNMLEAMIKTMLDSIKIAILDPTNYEARSNIMYIAAFTTGGANSCGKYIEWSCSPIASILEKHAGLSYQEAMCLVFPYWLEEVYDSNISLFKQMAINVWEISDDNISDKELAKLAVDKTAIFFNKIGIIKSLDNYTLDHFIEPINNLHEVKGMKYLDTEAIKRIISKCL